MADLFMIGGATGAMLARLGEKFAIHKATDMADPLAWLAENGGRIEYVATNGHDGI